MKENKYHNLDTQVSNEIRDGITEFPVACDYCDDDGRVETDNNGPIDTCPICHGKKQYMRAV